MAKSDRDCRLLALGVLVWAALAATAAAAEGTSVPQCAANPPQPTIPAKIAGFPGDRVYIHPRHPQLCTDARDQSCKAHAYVIVGDTVKLSPDCSGWRFMEFDGKKTTTGWVTSVRFDNDDANHGDHARTAFAESVAQSTHPACLEVERALNASLSGPSVHTRTILASVLDNGTPLEKLPEGVATEAEGNVAVSDTNIQGHALKAVTYTVGGTCHDDYLELWDPAFQKRVSVVDSNIDTGQAPEDYALEDLVKLAGQTYFTHSTRTGGLVLVDFGKDLTSQALCSVDMMPLKHEALKSAADADLCEAVQAGAVAAAPIEDVASYDVEPEALHLDAHGKELLDNMSGGFQITARGRLDIDNDGKPDDIGMLAFGNGKDGAGCGHDVDTAVPIKLNPDGKPAASSAFNQKMIESAGAGEDTRLLVFRGKVYFETRSHRTSDAAGSHDVWQLSANGRKNMCEFLPIQYRAVDAPGH